MNIDQEIIEINNKAKTAKDIVAEITRQEEILHKKRYLFTVIAFADLVDEIKSEDLFNIHEMVYFEFDSVFKGMDHTVDRAGYVIEFSFLDANKKCLSGLYSQSETSHPHKIFQDFFDNMISINLKNASTSLANLGGHILELNDGCREQIYDVFLSDELKVLLNYTNTKVSLPIADNKINKRPKL